MHKFRMIDMQIPEKGIGYLVDMDYFFDEQEREIVKDCKIYIIEDEKVKCEIKGINPFYKLAFTGVFLKTLEEERLNKENDAQ